MLRYIDVKIIHRQGRHTDFRRMSKTYTYSTTDDSIMPLDFVAVPDLDTKRNPRDYEKAQVIAVRPQPPQWLIGKMQFKPILGKWDSVLSALDGEGKNE